MGNRRGFLLLSCMVAVICLAMAPAMPQRQDDPCADPQFRAAMQQAQQAFAQVLQQYYSMPPEGRAAMDDAVRQATRGSGYNISSVPELQRLITQCRDWRPSVPTPQPVRTPTAVRTPAPTPTPSRATATPVGGQRGTGAGQRGPLDSAGAFLGRLVGIPPNTAQRRGALASAVASDGVYIGSGQIKLGWVLYGRTDMSDEQAKEEYQKRLNERKAALEAARKDAADHQATARSKYEKFTESPKNPADILDIMQADHAEATKRRNEELMAAAQAAGGLVVPDVVGMAMDTASATKDLASFAASAGKKMATGERLSPEDWELAANGFASYTSAVGAAAKSTVGLPIGIAQVGFGLMNAGAAQWWAYGLEKGIEQTQRPLAENARLLRHQIDVETIRTQYFDRQLEQVNQEGRYFDLWRP